MEIFVKWRNKQHLEEELCDPIFTDFNFFQLCVLLEMYCFTVFF